jgi:hypothetical protein
MRWASWTVTRRGLSRSERCVTQLLSPLALPEAIEAGDGEQSGMLRCKWGEERAVDGNELSAGRRNGRRRGVEQHGEDAVLTLERRCIPAGERGHLEIPLSNEGAAVRRWWCVVLSSLIPLCDRRLTIASRGAENDPQPEIIAQLAQEVYANDLLGLLVLHIWRFEFEASLPCFSLCLLERY